MCTCELGIDAIENCDLEESELLEEIYDDELVMCEKCDNVFEMDELEFFDGVCMCQSCFDESTFICGECNKREWRDSGYHDDDLAICDLCYENCYTRCSECDCVISCDDAIYDGDYSDRPYCDSCYQSNVEKYIHEYSFRPEPRFYGSGLFYGIELEIDGAGEDGNNAETLLDIANESGDTHLYCKRDGSLISGFELVSHPMSLEYHLNDMHWEQILNRCIDMGYKSHDCDTCGLHVHVGKNELGSNSSIQEDVIARIVFFIEKHWTNMLYFSRRTEAQMNRWANRYGCKDNPKDTLKHAKDNCGRYTCLNLQNNQTIEFRLFRGTLKYSSFIAALQLVDSICHSALSMSDEEFQNMSWHDFTTSTNGSKKELISYLKFKNLYHQDATDKITSKGDM